MVHQDYSNWHSSIFELKYKCYRHCHNKSVSRYSRPDRQMSGPTGRPAVSYISYYNLSSVTDSVCPLTPRPFMDLSAPKFFMLRPTLPYLLTCKNSAPWDQYLSRERISWFPWQPIEILKFRFRELFLVTKLDLCANFGAERSINGRGVSGLTESVTLLKL